MMTVLCWKHLTSQKSLFSQIGVVGRWLYHPPQCLVGRQRCRWLHSSELISVIFQYVEYCIKNKTTLFLKSNNRGHDKLAHQIPKYQCMKCRLRHQSSTWVEHVQYIFTARGKSAIVQHCTLQNHLKSPPSLPTAHADNFKLSKMLSHRP